LTLREEIEQVFNHARDQGKLTAYDANAGDGWEDPQNLKLLQQRIYPQTDIVFLNEAEARFLTGEQDPARAVLKASPDSEIVGIKLGTQGVVLRHRKQIYRCTAFPLPRSVQDTVGAGDSFHAAFLYFYLKGFPVLHCTVLGVANAASTVLQPGGVRGQLNPRQLAEMLKSYTIEVVKERNVEIALKKW
jgi:sugar/nucleoside kinase (ribokinase family)